MKASSSIFKLCLTIVFFIGFNTGFAQEEPDSTIYGSRIKPEIVIRDADFMRKYNLMVYKMKRIYPLAIHAKGLFEQYEKDIKTLDKNKQIKKYGKTAYKKLMDDFEYIIKDMYVSDGKLLIKLIHRETGMTVYDIIKKYRGGATAAWYQGMGKLFDQNTKTTYDPDGADWLIELVAKEIEAGKHKTIPFKHITKQEFKTKRKQEKKDSKARKKRVKEKKKQEKKAEKKKK